MPPPAAVQVTIRDIAEQLGISHSTVSRALRNSPLIGQPMRDRVASAARELGYIPNDAARAMRGEPSSLIGFVLPDVRPDFFSALTTEFGRVCAERGNSLMLSISQHDACIEEAQIRALRGLRVAGVLIYPTAGLTDESVRLLRDVPTVQIARKHPALDADFVGSNDAACMASLVRHLVDLGHRKIAFVGSDARFSPGRDRLDSFRDTLARSNVGIDDRMVRSGPATTAAGRDAVAALLAMDPPPTALVIGSAPIAEGALDILQERGLRIPDDISFTSFGDPFWYRSWGAGITTVAMPIAELVATSLSMLDTRPAPTDRNAGRRDVRVPSHVVLRRTTAAPR